MKRFFLFFCGLILTSVVLHAQDQPLSSRFIKVDGEASCKVDPNRIEVNVILSEKEFEGRVTLSSLESQLAQALKDVELDAKKRLVLNYQQEAVKNKRDSYGFKSYTVTLESTQEVDALFAALQSNGVFSASFGRTWHTDEVQIKQGLQVEAVVAARSKAVVLAGALDQQVGLPLQIIDGGTYSSGMSDGNLLMRSSSNGSNALELPSVDVRQITFRQTISVYFELK